MFFKNKKETERLEQLAKEEEKRQLKAELLQQIREEQEVKERELKEAEEAAKEEARLKHEAEEKARVEEENKLKNSENPWMVVRGEVVDKESGGVKMELDWNDAFIKHLRKNGYVGTDDESIVQHYLAVIAQQAAEDMAKQKTNEFE